jgi:hypothetical protein
LASLKHIFRQLHQIDGRASPDCGLDPAERDALFDVVGLHFTGHLWPRSGGTEATRQFVADLQHAMLGAGWKVDSFAVAVSVRAGVEFPGRAEVAIGSAG